ncbi:hypothetical protein GGQ84_002889, partial [Desulfitispora alkaliphila]
NWLFCGDLIILQLDPLWIFLLVQLHFTMKQFIEKLKNGEEL